MEFKIEKMETMTFTGYVTYIDSAKGKGYEQVPNLWKNVMEKNLFKGLIEHKDDLGPVGISFDYEWQTGNFKYMIGVRSETDKLDNTEKLIIEDPTFAIFTAVGPMPKAIQETIQEVHTNWLPNSDYHHTGVAEMEVYSNGDPSSEDYLSYLWMTVKK